MPFRRGRCTGCDRPHRHRTVEGVTLATRSLVYCLSIVCLLFSGMAFPCHAADDVVVMRNGDRFTGEIKSLEHGELVFKAGYMTDSVRLDWKEVERIQSPRQFRVEMGPDSRQLGTISRDGDAESNFSVQQGESEVARVPARDVSSIEPIEQSRLERFDGDISFGFTFTSGNQQTQSSLTAAVNYVGSRQSIETSGSSIFSGQQEGENTSRQNLRTTYSRFFAPRWKALALADFLRSDQQELALRTTLGAAVERDMLRSASTSFSLLGGLAWNRERFQDLGEGATRRDNMEALGGLAYGYNRFDAFSIDAHAYSFVSLTTPGRVRFDLGATWSLDVWRDLHWSLTVYENVDTRPPANTARNDFGITSTFGWKF
jgi:Protein of unknown function, DUF481